LIISELFSVEKQRIVDNLKARMPHFLKTTLTVTFVIFLISIWALEAKIAGKVSKLLYQNIELSAILKTMDNELCFAQEN